MAHAVTAPAHSQSPAARNIQRRSGSLLEVGGSLLEEESEEPLPLPDFPPREDLEFLTALPLPGFSSENLLCPATIASLTEDSSTKSPVTVPGVSSIPLTQSQPPSSATPTRSLIENCLIVSCPCFSSVTIRPKRMPSRWHPCRVRSSHEPSAWARSEPKTLENSNSRSLIKCSRSKHAPPLQFYKHKL